MKRWSLGASLVVLAAAVPHPAVAADPPAYISRAEPDATETRVGGANAFRVVVYNETAAPLTLSDLQDRLPDGFRYVAGSSTRSGTAIPDPVVLGDGTLSFGAITLGVGWPDYRLDLHFEVVVAETEGFYKNRATIFLDGAVIDSKVSDDIAVRAPSTLVAHAWVIDTSSGGTAFPELSATLTRALTGTPIVGAAVDFEGGSLPFVGYARCRGITDVAGVARCALDGTLTPAAVASNAGFDATFRSNYLYYPSTSHGSIVG